MIERKEVPTIGRLKEGKNDVCGLVAREISNAKEKHQERRKDDEDQQRYAA